MEIEPLNQNEQLEEFELIEHSEEYIVTHDIPVIQDENKMEEDKKDSDDIDKDMIIINELNPFWILSNGMIIIEKQNSLYSQCIEFIQWQQSHDLFLELILL